MKRIILLFSSLVLLVALAACGKSGEKAEADNNNDAAKSGKGDVIEAEVEDASYILAGDSGEGEDSGLLLINLNIKNVSDSSIDLFPENNMQLYDGDQQIDPSSEASMLLDRDTTSSIGADKQKSMPVVFDVDKDTEYELNIEPRLTDPDAGDADVNIPIDTSEYNDSLEELQNPGKALEAYVETIFFDKDNSDYEELVSADKSDIQDDALKAFKERLELNMSSKISDGDMEKYYKSFKQASAEQDEIEAEVVENAGGKAKVELSYKALSFEDLMDELNEYKNKYREKNGFDSEKEDEYALKKFDSAIDKIEAKEGDDLDIQMEENEGKWSVDDSDWDMTENIIRVFAEGAVR